MEAKGIKVTVERYMTGNVKMVEVVGISALTKGQLPQEYTEGELAVWRTNGGDLESNRTEKTEDYLLETSGNYTNKDFQKRLDYVRRAGLVLTKINEDIRKQRELHKWDGMKEIII